jgi:flagellar hook-associated protein 3 FlgL
MRISTFAFHTRSTNDILSQQSAVSNTQNQIATGKRIQSPADDPIGSVHILELQRAQSELDQFGRNANALTARLNVEESALKDAGTLVQRVRELVLQANNGTIDANARAAIAAEVSQRAQEAVDIANRRDGNGEYLFAGFAVGTKPFTRTAAGVTYAGDQGVRSLQIAQDQRIADSHSGFAAFLNIEQGNGTFFTGAATTNTGNGIIDTGRSPNPAAFAPDTYTISFSAPTPDTYTITNSTATVVGTGAYTAGAAIDFAGAQVAITGAPAAGDSFTVSTARRQDLFSALDGIAASLRTANESPATRAQLSTQLNNALQQLDQVEQHLLTVRTDVGARLNSIDSTAANQEGLSVEVQRNLSLLQDVDYASAISQLNRQLLGLEAAQASYTRIASLSLFNFLR